MSGLTKLRLTALDGLRGLAIVFVVLNHMDSGYIINAFPILLRPFIAFLFSSGTIAVTFFYILSGFLMAYLYKNPQPHDFIQKRYARIFPPFIVMAISMTFFRLYPDTPLIARIVVILALAGLMRFLWMQIVEKYKIGPKLITAFMFLQTLVLVWYGFIIMRHPPIWFAAMPQWIREMSIALVNMTLTLPAGDYIPLLDGVYWSLNGEVLFYILYPYLIAPTARAMERFHSVYRQVLILFLIPFFWGLHLLFVGFRGLSMLYIGYFFYFCIGIVIAYSPSIHKPLQLPKIISILLPVCAALTVFIGHELLFASKATLNVFISLLLAFPFGAIVYLTIRTPVLHDNFNKKILLYLGSVSYPLYIIHTAIIDGLHLHLKPINSISNVIFIGLAGTLALSVSHLFHHIVEKLYFQFKPKHTNEGYVSDLHFRISVIILSISIIGIVFTKYMTGYNFFSRVYNHTHEQIKYVNQSSPYVELTDEPVEFEFTSPDNNLGIITLKIEHTGTIVCTLPNPHDKQMLQIMIKEKNEKDWYATQITNTAEIGKSESFPFGFPTIQQSKNKVYVVRMNIINHHSRVLLHTKGSLLKSVHQLNKKHTITHPQVLLGLVKSKLLSVLTNPEAQKIVFLLSPFMSILIVISFFKKK